MAASLSAGLGILQTGNSPAAVASNLPADTHPQPTRRTPMRYRITAAFVATLMSCTFALAQPRPVTRPVEPPQPVARSKIVAVTVYQGTALVTREVDVPEGQNLVEVVVSPLPEQTVDSS